MPSGKDILFFSDTIFDIDLGIIKYMQKNCSESKYLDLDKLNNDNLFFISYLIEECNTNILDSIFKDEYKQDTPNLYNELITTKYQEIIKLSPMTNILDMIITFKKAELNTGIIPVVSCKEQCEIDKIKEIDQSIDCQFNCTDNDIFDLDLNRYTRIFIRNIKDIMKFDIYDKLLGKDIVVLSYRYNFELNNPIKLLEKYTSVADVNILESAIPYTGYIPPLG